MAVVKQGSNLIRNPQQGDQPIDPLMKAGRVNFATGTVTCAADDSAGSTYRLFDIPSYALLHEDTFFDVENWGFAQVQLGTLSDAAALVDQTKATENVVTPIAIGDANHGKRLWEVLGLAADPGGHIAIFAHAAANATGAGAMPFRLAWIDNN